MNDTAPAVMTELRARLRARSAEDRIRMACGMLASARALREAARGGSPSDPATRQIRRLVDTYGDELDARILASVAARLRSLQRRESARQHDDLGDAADVG